MASIYNFNKDSYEKLRMPLFYFFLIVIILVFVGNFLFTKDRIEKTEGKIYKIERNLDTIKFFYSYYSNGVSYKGIHVALSDTLIFDTTGIQNKNFKVLYGKDNPTQALLEIK